MTFNDVESDRVEGMGRKFFGSNYSSLLNCSQLDIQQRERAREFRTNFLDEILLFMENVRPIFMRVLRLFS